MLDQESLKIQTEINKLETKLKAISRKKNKKAKIDNKCKKIFWTSEDSNIEYLRNELLVGLEIEYKTKIKKPRFSNLSIANFPKIAKKYRKRQEKIEYLEEQKELIADDLYVANEDLYEIQSCYYDLESFEESLKRLLKKTTNQNLLDQFERGILAAKLI